MVSFFFFFCVYSNLNEPACAAAKRMATPRRFVFFFCRKGKLGGGNNRLSRDESFESCLIEQRCSVVLPYVTFCFQTLRLLTRGLSLESPWPIKLRL